MTEQLKRQGRFWCDICSKPALSEDGNFINQYTTCYLLDDWRRHLNSKKHIKNKKKVYDDESSIYCKYCKQYFTEEGYEIHKKRNELLWEMKDKKMDAYIGVSCNNFTRYGKRYASMKQLISNKSNHIKSKSVAKQIKENVKRDLKPMYNQKFYAYLNPYNHRASVTQNPDFWHWEDVKLTYPEEDKRECYLFLRNIREIFDDNSFDIVAELEDGKHEGDVRLILTDNAGDGEGVEIELNDYVYNNICIRRTVESVAEEITKPQVREI